MKIAKRVIIALLALCMIFNMVIPTFAAETETIDSGICGDNLTWELDYKGVLTISGKGDMYDYDKATMPWYDYRTNIKSVTIENNVTRIGDYAFRGCNKMTTVTIPNSITSIGEYAFWVCSSLNSIYITDLAAWCKINFDSWSSNPLYYAHDLYLNKVLVTNIEIPSNVTSISDNAFENCNSLISVTIANDVINIGKNAFSNCENLTNVTISDNVNSIDAYAFYNCINLTDISIGNGVTTIGNSAFEGCIGLIEVTIPDNVKYIGSSAFYDCSNITDAFISESVTYIGNDAFYNCSSLNNIVFNGNAPQFGELCFSGVTATAYYLANNNTWTEKIMQNYGGDITWVAYGTSRPMFVIEAKTDAEEYLVNAPVTITIITENTVSGVNLANEYGKFISKKILSCKENDDGTLTWTVSTSFGTKGERTISIYVVDEYGENVASGIDVSFIVDTVISGSDDEVVIYDVIAPPTSTKNGVFVITVETTTSTTKIGIFNENNIALGKISQSYIDKDDARIWTIAISVASSGSRKLSVKATDRSGVWSEGKQMNIEIK